MVIFPIVCVLRGFLFSTYAKYASNRKPCAALTIEKIPHFYSEIVFCSYLYKTDRKTADEKELPFVD
jgi:hypothetical protein